MVEAAERVTGVPSGTTVSFDAIFHCIPLGEDAGIFPGSCTVGVVVIEPVDPSVKTTVVGLGKIILIPSGKVSGVPAVRLIVDPSDKVTAAAASSIALDVFALTRMGLPDTGEVGVSG
jgi:hypothetical protein